MDTRLDTLADAAAHFDNPLAVAVIKSLISLLAEQQDAIRELKADAQAMESLVGTHEAERLARLVAPARRCPGCHALSDPRAIKELGHCLSCDEAEERLEARV